MTDTPRGPMRAGFTVVELAWVMVLLGVLGTVAAPRVLSARDGALEAMLRSDLRELALEQEIFRSDAWRYAASLEELELTPSPGVEITVTGGGDGWSATARHGSLMHLRCGIAVTPASRWSPDDGRGAVRCTESTEGGGAQAVTGGPGGAP